MTPADVLPDRLRESLASSKDPGERLALRNLQAEDRLDDVACEAFRSALAAAESLDDLLTATYRAVRRVPCKDRAAVASESPTWFNHQTERRLIKAGVLDFNPYSDEPVTIASQFFQFEDGGPRSLWIAPHTSPIADDVADRLGLAWVVEGDVIWRLDVDVADQTAELFIPTALDAGAAWYWRRPPVGHARPWGHHQAYRRLQRRSPGADRHAPEVAPQDRSHPRIVQLNESRRLPQGVAMIGFSELESMTDDDFATWLRDRLRGGRTDPPYHRDHEEPETFVVRAHRQGSTGLKHRIECGLAHELRDALGLAEIHDNRGKGILNASAAVLDLKLHASLDPVYALILRHGHGPGGTRSLPLAAERALMRALLVLSAPDGHWWPFWHALWTQDREPDLWAIASLGLRKTDPASALKVLPLAMARYRTNPDWPVENLLMAFHNDANVPKAAFRAALNGLDAEQRAEAHAALARLGDEWPERVMGADEAPAFVRKAGLQDLPRNHHMFDDSQLQAAA